MKNDSAFYKLFAKYPASFFQLVGQPEVAADYLFDSVEVKERLQVEIKNKAYRIDGVFRPRQPESGKPTIFTEVQSGGANGGTVFAGGQIGSSGN
ncbi:DUF2887 domain-containing protein [Synechococcus sp. PCC 7336]|uniref:DUF2887 domain-containing protein n=1 Tax=Synechococcus sp. PCC 7336 TaxID=195250 RepID=UPI00034D1A4D|nr:DUF2887 domain-containing protein [Synechococcus sp. PCC 7336]